MPLPDVDVEPVDAVEWFVVVVPDEVGVPVVDETVVVPDPAGDTLLPFVRSVDPFDVVFAVAVEPLVAEPPDVAVPPVALLDDVEVPLVVVSVAVVADAVGDTLLPLAIRGALWLGFVRVALPVFAIGGASCGGRHIAVPI